MVAQRSRAKSSWYPQEKLGLRHPRHLFLYFALQTLFPSLLTYPPGSPHFSLCSLSCPSPHPWEYPALSAVSCMLTYNPSDPRGDHYFPTPFFCPGHRSISKVPAEGLLITSPILQMRVLRQWILRCLFQGHLPCLERQL